VGKTEEAEGISHGKAAANEHYKDELNAKCTPFSLLFNPDDGDDKFIPNVSELLLNCITLQYRRPYSSCAAIKFKTQMCDTILSSLQHLLFNLLYMFSITYM
jgi:hypothetical protein